MNYKGASKRHEEEASKGNTVITLSENEVSSYD